MEVTLGPPNYILWRDVVVAMEALHPDRENDDYEASLSVVSESTWEGQAKPTDRTATSIAQNKGRIWMEKGNVRY